MHLKVVLAAAAALLYTTSALPTVVISIQSYSPGVFSQGQPRFTILKDTSSAIRQDIATMIGVALTANDTAQSIVSENAPTTGPVRTVPHVPTYPVVKCIRTTDVFLTDRLCRKPSTPLYS